MTLIDKSALVAEIERRLDELYNLLPNASDVENGTITISEACNTGKYTALESFKDYVDTLEVKDLPIWEKVSPDTGQTTLYKDGVKSYLERFGYRIDLKDLDKLPKKNLRAQKGE